MKITDAITLIPENTMDEALESIQSVRLEPRRNLAMLRCHLTNRFSIAMQVSDSSIELSAVGWPGTKSCSVDTLLPALRRIIYEIDEAVAAGQYRQPTVSPFVFERPAPPAHMDLPTWDEETASWYDAEY
jgi:hypothetical protein